MSIKLADHHYFTRSKGRADSCPRPNANTAMGDNNEEVSLTDFVVAQPTAADQNDLIMQLMQQIAEMRVEMQRMQDLSNRVSSFNPPRDGRPPLHYPPSSTEQVQNLLSNPIQNPPTIDLTTLYPHHATTSCQAPHPP